MQLSEQCIWVQRVDAFTGTSITIENTYVEELTFEQWLVLAHQSSVVREICVLLEENIYISGTAQK